MTGTSAVPQPYFGPRGLVVPDEAAIYTGVFADMNAAFGGNLNPAVETPQGQWVSSLTAMLGEENNQLLYYVNGVDPALNSGRMQDAIGRIYFLSRIPATSTTVQATCTGLAGTIIPTGALALDTDGNLYNCTGGGTISVGGSISLPFACLTTGPIACAATSLNTIYQAQPGWDSISNPSDGVLGRNVETRAAFEARRAASVAINAVSILSAVRAEVLAVSGVLDCYATENPTGSPVTIGGYTLEAHSLYVAVSGGDPQAVAEAIWRKKPPGCAYNGNTTETVTDSNSGYEPPFPVYSVKFETAVSTPVLFAISVTNSDAVPANATTLIQNAIIAAFAGEDGGPAAQIGATIYALRYYPPIAALGSWAQVISIQIGSQNTPGATFTGVISGTALTSSSVTGTIAIGQTLVGAGIPDGTTIISGSGSSWVISTSLTIASETMYGVTAALNDLTMNISQAPTISAANIAVTLVG